MNTIVLDEDIRTSSITMLQNIMHINVDVMTSTTEQFATTLFQLQQCVDQFITILRSKEVHIDEDLTNYIQGATLNLSLMFKLYIRRKYHSTWEE